MSEETMGKYNPERDPEMMRYWMRRGHKSAAFLLVIPGCTLIGYGAGLLASSVIPYSVIGLGAGLLVWGLTVVLTR